MIRILAFLAVLAAIALGANWLADRPGEIAVTWQGYEYRTSVLVGFAILLAAAAVLAVVWGGLRFIVRLPTRLALAADSRRRTRGSAALTSGMVAVGAGDSRGAKRFAEEAERLLGNEPLVLLLKAQAAQLGGDRPTAAASFNAMLRLPETRLLGLRGLHVEARRRGDGEAAHHYAAAAQEIAPLPWAGQAVLDHHAAQSAWTDALAAVERNAAGKLIDKATANRQRAVLNTALALDKAEREPEAALALAREAVRLAPDLVPAAALAGRLLARQGEIRKATRLLEAAWKRLPHPDIAESYLNVRPGDSARDRLVRAHTLGELALDDPEGRLTVGRAALEARDFDFVRREMAPLFQPDSPYGRPTVRACLLMADLEEAAGAPGRAREWLARASRAARDPVWMADGVVSDRWAPVSPVTGRLDGFAWQRPSEHLSGPAPAPFPAFAESEIGDVEATTAMIEGPAPPPPGPEPAEPTAVGPDPNGAQPAATPDRPTASGLPAVVAPSAAGEARAGERTDAAFPTRPAPGPRAVVFPLPGAPDDPGPDQRRMPRIGTG